MRRAQTRPNVTRRGMVASLLALCIGAIGWTSNARAGISSVNMFRNNESTQTGNGQTLTLLGSFFSAGLFSVNPNDYTSVQMTYPGSGSPVNLSSIDPTSFGFQTPYLANQAAMDAAYPTGTYSFAASNGSTTDTTSFSYTTDYYPQSQPYFAGTNYQDLQGMNAAAPFTFQFSPFVTGSLPSGSSSNIFLTIYDRTTNQFVFNDSFLPSTTTSLVLPSNTLVDGHTYTAQLIYDNRITVASPGATFDAQIGFDLRTDVTFSAVPEPATLALFAPACACLAWMTLRRRAR